MRGGKRGSMDRRSEQLTRRSLLLGALAGALAACGSGVQQARVPLDAPEQSTTLGPGDVFNLRIVGEKDLPEEYQVASDGTVDLPYVQTVQAAGLEPQELARRVRELLIERQILSDPSVVVRVNEYRSKQISVLGQVQRPGSFPFQPGMTLVQGVSLAGGLNSIAARRLRLTRRSKQGGTRTVVLDFDAITSGAAEDPPLQSGDRIFVEERVF